MKFQMTFALLAFTLATGPSSFAAEKRAPANIFTREDGNPYIFLKAPLKENQRVVELFNTFNDATVYSVSMNEIINGGGTGVEVGRKLNSENFLNQITRVLSLFDLYFNYKIRNSQPSGEIALSFVPMKNRDADSMEDYQFQLLPALFQNAWSVVAPLTGQFVKAEPADKDGYKKYVANVRDGISDNLKGRYPMTRSVVTNNLGAKVAYLTRSFQPLYSSSWLKFDGNESFFKSTLLLSPIGMPDVLTGHINSLHIPVHIDTGMAIVDEISYGDFDSADFNAIRLYAMKNFKLNDEFTLNIDFGRLKTEQSGVTGFFDHSGNTSQNVAAFKEDSDSGTHDFIFGSNIRHNDGLIAKGIIHLADNQPHAEVINQIFKNFKIEVGIHRLTLELKRPKSDLQAKAGIPTTLVQDMPPVSIKDGLHVNANSSKVTLSLITYRGASSPMQKKKGEHGLLAANKRDLIDGAQSNAQLALCAWEGVLKSSSECRMTFTSTNDFTKFVDRFVAKMVAQQTAASVDYTIASTSDALDKGLEQITNQALGLYRSGQEVISQLTKAQCMLKDCSKR